MRTHWLGEDVRTIDTTLDQIERLLPVFARHGLGTNRLLDVIVREQSGEPLPVATVSKRYALVQHAEATGAVTAEIRRQGIDSAGVPARLLISEYGSRIALRATLPAKYSCTPPDGHPMALTFECFNSVDRTVPLMAAVGWFRFVCSNGLVVGTTTARVRQRHSPPLNIGEISAVLAEGLAAAVHERTAFAKWSGTRVALRDLVSWVDGPVADAWGPYAAARVYGIATTGEDGMPERTFRTVAPHERTLIDTAPVPGAKDSCDDAYGIAQVLAWVAAQRNHVAERLQWRAQIPALMGTHRLTDGPSQLLTTVFSGTCRQSPRRVKVFCFGRARNSGCNVTVKTLRFRGFLTDKLLPGWFIGTVIMTAPCSAIFGIAGCLASLSPFHCPWAQTMLSSRA